MLQHSRLSLCRNALGYLESLYWLNALALTMKSGCSRTAVVRYLAQVERLRVHSVHSVFTVHRLSSSLVLCRLLLSVSSVTSCVSMHATVIKYRTGQCLTCCRLLVSLSDKETPAAVALYPFTYSFITSPPWKYYEILRWASPWVGLWACSHAGKYQKSHDRTFKKFLCRSTLPVAVAWSSCRPITALRYVMYFRFYRPTLC